MVGADRVDHTLAQSLPEHFPVFAFPDRRRTLVAGHRRVSPRRQMPGNGDTSRPSTAIRHGVRPSREESKRPMTDAQYARGRNDPGKDRSTAQWHCAPISAVATQDADGSCGLRRRSSARRRALHLSTRRAPRGVRRPAPNAAALPEICLGRIGKLIDSQWQRNALKPSTPAAINGSICRVTPGTIPP